MRRSALLLVTAAAALAAPASAARYRLTVCRAGTRTALGRRTLRAW